MLNEIVAATRARLEEGGTADYSGAPDARPFGAALQQPGLQVIAEIKRRSPSAGVLAADLDPVRQSREYARGGAAAISVLTEPDYFGGSLRDLVAVRHAVDLPILRKDFIIDPRQVIESRLAGADALLLIVAALDRAKLQQLLAECAKTGIEALVEAHDRAEAEMAVDLGAKLLGINNRNLHTFRTDLSVAEEIGPCLPSERVLVAESGVSNPAGAARMVAAGYDAVLVGEALVVAADPAALLRELRAVGG
jgi:indole-3-glycerol phosphate synthase